MTITTRTIICFQIPDEYQKAKKFEEENNMEEWKKSETSGCFFYVQEKTVFTKGGE